MSVCWNTLRTSRREGHCRAATAATAAMALALATLGGTAACGAVSGDPTGGSAPSSFSTLVAGSSVSPVPTSSPRVRCIRAITDALRAAAGDHVPARRATADLAAAYGPDSSQMRAFHVQLASFREDVREHGADVAATLAWPALDAACDQATR